MNNLLSVSDVAELLRITEDQVRRRTRRDGWPHVRFSGKTIRYRHEHIATILDLYEASPDATPRPPLGGQTARSRRRSA